MSEFKEFGKIARLNREIIITEKIDGTNAQILIRDLMDGEVTETPPLGNVDVEGYSYGFGVWAGSRNRWLLPGKSDNFGFAGWVQDNIVNLAVGLGPGRHFGEWWGAGIQRRYGLDHKRFSLFNTNRWGASRDMAKYPEAQPIIDHGLVSVVPVLYKGTWQIQDQSSVQFSNLAADAALQHLRRRGSVAAQGFMDPEGIVVFHTASGQLFKATIKGDESRKGSQQ